MRLGRWVRHLTSSHARARLRFPKRTLDAIEQAVARAERAHAGEIRFVIETALPTAHLFADLTPRTRALELFAALRVWDTEHNNGVLVYVELADRMVEIICDRGVAARVTPEEWQGVCRLMEEHYRAGRFEAGSIARSIRLPSGEQRSRSPHARCACPRLSRPRRAPLDLLSSARK